MCGTSRDCRKLCLWLTPASVCILIAAFGFSLIGSCLPGWYFSRKVEDDFIQWTCNVEVIYEQSGNMIDLNPYKKTTVLSYKTTPVRYPEDAHYMVRDDGYIRKKGFMTKSPEYTVDNNVYICNLYGYNVNTTFTVDHTHTIVWDVEKMQRFFNITVALGFFLSFLGLIGFLCIWRCDKQGEVMHNKVGWIFFWLLFAIGTFTAGVCALAVNLYPYNNSANFCGGVLLGISFVYPCFCLWATCSVAKEMGLKPGDDLEMGEVHQIAGEQQQGETIAVKDEGQTTNSVEGEIEGTKC